MECDYLIVGAGYAGLVLAERLSSQLGQKCLIVERRAHIGGNSYDEYDDHGVLLHKYGPHYFRTNSPRIREYLSQFTEWRPVDYMIRSWARGRYWSFPVNLNTYEELVGHPATEEEFIAYLEKVKVPIENPANSEEVIVSQVGWEFYEMFFKGYTLKQWKRHPKELDASVCGRIPIRTNRDDRYLREEFQAIPKAGYARMFERMVAASPGVRILLRADYKELLPFVKYRHMIYTGPIDDFYDLRFGALPYRSLRFERESFTAEQLVEREKISGRAGFWQPAMQVNYPNEEEFTRIVEIKHATGQQCTNTTIVREYPEDYGPGKEAYYPVPAPDSQAMYEKYKELASLEENVSFVGRLATYRYYNMDQVVGMALAEFERLKERHSQAA
jgi:UDP-galactopyranose mutase